MKIGENITNMYKRFLNLVDDLKGLEKRFKTVDLIKKVLISLLELWPLKVKTIEESKYLTKMRMDKLIGSFLTYAMKRKLKEEKIQSKRDNVLKANKKERCRR